MQRADVIVVGGGPAGSGCARRLAAAGLDVLVLDCGRYPRDKPCVGWITPELVRAAGFDLAHYAQGRTLQPVRRLRVGWIGGASRDVDYGEAVSFGILRRELDAWLLAHSGARVCVENVGSLRRARGRWVVEEAFAAPFLVGAGGRFCPVARELKAGAPSRSVVVAQEMAIRLTAAQSACCRVEPDRPELDFTSDLSAYGWCVRRRDGLSVGLAGRAPDSLAGDLRAYVGWLERCARIPVGLREPVRNHGYRLPEGTPPRVSGEGVLLAGDAACLVHTASGEGMLAAVLSGQVAADVILETLAGVADAFDRYPTRLADEIGPRFEWTVPGPLRALAGSALFGSPGPPLRPPERRPAGRPTVPAAPA